MKTLCFLFALLCCADSQAARTAFQIRCEDTVAKAVSVLTSRQNGYTVNNTVSYHALSAMKQQRAANAYVLGLTKTESRAAVTAGGPILSDRLSGYECISPKITVSLFYSPVIIYIGREFKPDTCAYRHILAHEMRHLNTYLDHLPKVEAVVRAALAKRFDNKPLYAPGGQVQALLEKEINTGWLPYIKNEMAKVELLQSAIDTPKEYARLSKVCEGEVQSLIGPAKRTR